MHQNISYTDFLIMQMRRIYYKINDALAIRYLMKNWFEIILFRIGIKKKVILKFRDNTNILIQNKDEYFKFWDSEQGQLKLLNILNFKTKININRNKHLINFAYKNYPISFYYDSERQLSNTIGLINEQFVREDYKLLNVKGKRVIDIGANIGDAAIYFALKGAKHVYAFEPYHYSFNIAKKNIKINRLEKKINIINQGCGKDEVIKMNANIKNYGGSIIQTSKTGKKIRINSLETIVENYNIKNGILKIDCEGCEYAILLNSKKETLQIFDEIMIEYHYGYLNLIKKLRACNFRTSYSKPRFMYNRDLDQDIAIGMIYAKKII